MLHNVSHFTIYVEDDDAALAFYTEKLGFQLIADDVWGESNRWLVVGIDMMTFPQIVIQKVEAGSDAIGKQGGIVINVADAKQVYTDWSEKGVQFVEAPTLQMWGLQALAQDIAGNMLVILEPQMSDGAQQ